MSWIKKDRISYLILVKINVYLPNHDPSHGLFGDFPLHYKASKLNLENNDFYRPCKRWFNLTGQGHQTGLNPDQMCEICGLLSNSTTLTFSLQDTHFLQNQTKMSESFPPR